ncbi:MAG: hypothetical protein ACR2KX_11820 [Chitinophagaceae bacterium]
MDTFFKNSIKIFLIFLVFDLYAAFTDNETISAYTSLLIVTLSWVNIIIGVIKYKLINRNGLPLFDKTIFLIFLSWCFINIVRSIYIPIAVPQSFPRYIGGIYATPAWVLPVFVYYGATLNIWKEIWSIAISFTKVFIILLPLYLFFRFNNTYFFSNYIMLIQFLPLLIINWHFINKKYKKFIITGFIIACLYTVINSERFFLFHLMFYPVAYFLFLFFNKVSNRIKNFYKLSFFLITIGISFFFLYSGAVSKFVSDPHIKENVQEFEKSNLNTDSRKMVYEDFFKDFTTTEDWIFGRGLLGSTFSEQYGTLQIVRGIEANVFQLPLGYRLEVEGGYLMYILKVGLIGLVLLLLLSLRAILLAFFSSRNHFVKACAFIIIEWLINMYPYGIPEYNFSNILFWLCIGVCLSKEMRSYSNQEIKNIFLNINDVSIFKRRFKV